MRGLEKNRMKRDIRTYKHTHGHRDSMIESAQWADSMKTSEATAEDCEGLFLLPEPLDYSRIRLVSKFCGKIGGEQKVLRQPWNLVLTALLYRVYRKKYQ